MSGAICGGTVDPPPHTPLICTGYPYCVHVDGCAALRFTPDRVQVYRDTIRAMDDPVLNTRLRDRIPDHAHHLVDGIYDGECRDCRDDAHREALAENGPPPAPDRFRIVGRTNVVGVYDEPLVPPYEPPAAEYVPPWRDPGYPYEGWSRTVVIWFKRHISRSI